MVPIVPGALFLESEALEVSFLLCWERGVEGLVDLSEVLRLE